MFSNGGHESFDKPSNLSDHSISSTAWDAGDSNTTTRPHHLYHVDVSGGLVVFQVGDTEYKLLKRQFTSSPFFKNLLSKPGYRRTSVDGSPQTESIILEGVTNQEFEHFLWLLESRSYEPKQVEFHLDRWSAILHLSTQWQFTDIREQAIRIISAEAKTIDPIVLVLLARKCNVPEWWKSSFAFIIDRPTFMTYEESTKLGLETALKLAELRERRRAAQKTPLSPVFERLMKSTDDAPSLVQRGFDDKGDPIWHTLT